MMACGSSATSAVQRCYLWQPPSGAREATHGLRRHPQRPGETRWHPVKPSHETYAEGEKRGKRRRERRDRKRSEEIGRWSNCKLMQIACDRDPLLVTSLSHRPVAARISACSIVFIKALPVIADPSNSKTLLMDILIYYSNVYTVYTYMFRALYQDTPLDFLDLFSRCHLLYHWLMAPLLPKHVCIGYKARWWVDLINGSTLS